MKDAIDIFEDKLKILLRALVNQAEAHKTHGLCGRTHGQIGSPDYLWAPVCYLGF